MTRSMPNRFASRGATGAEMPKNRTGSAVSRPATALLNPASAEMVPISGPTDTTAGRRFAATSITPTAVMITPAVVRSFASWGRVVRDEITWTARSRRNGEQTEPTSLRNLTFDPSRRWCVHATTTSWAR